MVAQPSDERTDAAGARARARTAQVDTESVRVGSATSKISLGRGAAEAARAAGWSDSSGAPAPGRRDAETPTPPPILSPQRAVEREELEADATRLQVALAVGLPLWLLFGIIDWVLVRYIVPGRLSFYLAIRAAGAAFFALAYARLRFGALPTRAVLRGLDRTCYTVASVLLTVMTVEAGGIQSLYLAGIALVLVCHALTMADHWQRNVVTFGLPLLGHALTMAAIALVVPEYRAQFRNERARAVCAVMEMHVIATYVFLVIGGHIMWTSRQQLRSLRSIGRYDLKSRIGKGAMGDVWVAYDRTLKRDVAMKLIRQEVQSDTTTLARFEREVRATAELKHPNTIRVFDHGITEDGHWFYAMELLDGVDLERLVALEGPLLPARVARIGAQVARALAEAHGHGIVHRDVKPANLFLATIGGERDFVKVLDFGIARILGVGSEAALPTLTEGGSAVGTPAYMAPEVILGEPAGPGSDLYSLGAVLYFLVCGRRPFEEMTQAAVLFAHVNGKVIPPTAKFGRPIPADVERIIVRCLAKKPADRHKSALELAEALSTAAAQLELAKPAAATSA